MAGWQEREEYFRKHGPKPAAPYVERSECGCYTEWPTPDLGEAHKCYRCDLLGQQEMARMRQRRSAFFGR